MEKKAEGYVLSSLLLKIRFFTNLFARGSKFFIKVSLILGNKKSAESIS